VKPSRGSIFPSLEREQLDQRFRIEDTYFASLSAWAKCEYIADGTARFTSKQHRKAELEEIVYLARGRGACAKTIRERNVGMYLREDATSTQLATPASRSVALLFISRIKQNIRRVKRLSPLALNRRETHSCEYIVTVRARHQLRHQSSLAGTVITLHALLA
jgi:hypothetical protein